MFCCGGLGQMGRGLLILSCHLLDGRLWVRRRVGWMRWVGWMGGVRRVGRVWWNGNMNSRWMMGRFDGGVER